MVSKGPSLQLDAPDDRMSDERRPDERRGAVEHIVMPTRTERARMALSQSRSASVCSPLDAAHGAATPKKASLSLPRPLNLQAPNLAHFPRLVALSPSILRSELPNPKRPSLLRSRPIYAEVDFNCICYEYNNGRDRQLHTGWPVSRPTTRLHLIAPVSLRADLMAPSLLAVPPFDGAVFCAQPTSCSTIKLAVCR